MAEQDKYPIRLLKIVIGLFKILSIILMGKPNVPKGTLTDSKIPGL